MLWISTTQCVLYIGHIFFTHTFSPLITMILFLQYRYVLILHFIGQKKKKKDEAEDRLSDLLKIT